MDILIIIILIILFIIITLFKKNPILFFIAFIVVGIIIIFKAIKKGNEELENDQTDEYKSNIKNAKISQLNYTPIDNKTSNYKPIEYNSIQNKQITKVDKMENAIKMKNYEEYSKCINDIKKIELDEKSANDRTDEYKSNIKNEKTSDLKQTPIDNKTSNYKPIEYNSIQNKQIAKVDKIENSINIKNYEEHSKCVNDIKKIELDEKSTNDQTDEYKSNKKNEKTSDLKHTPIDNKTSNYKPIEYNSIQNKQIAGSDKMENSINIKNYEKQSKCVNVFNHYQSKNVQKEFVVIDIETTGLSKYTDEIIEIAAIRFKECEEVETFHTLIKPNEPITPYITKINGITNDMVANSPNIKEVMPKLIDFLSDNILVAHNANFDISFIEFNARLLDYSVEWNYIDTVQVARKLFPNLPNHKQRTVLNAIGYKQDVYHRALDDCRGCAEIIKLGLSFDETQNNIYIKENVDNIDVNFDVQNKTFNYKPIEYKSNQNKQITKVDKIENSINIKNYEEHSKCVNDIKKIELDKKSTNDQTDEYISNIKKTWIKELKSHKNIPHRYNGNPIKYYYHELKICIISDKIPNWSTIENGTGILLKQEPKNEFDNKAVMIVTENTETYIGYLYRGKVQDIANQFIDEKRDILGYLSYIDTSTNNVKINIGFYHVEDFNKSVIFDLIGNGREIYQERIYMRKKGDQLQIQYDPEKDKYLVLYDYEDIIGYVPATKRKIVEDADRWYKAIISDVTEKNEKFIVTIEFFYTDETA